MNLPDKLTDLHRHLDGSMRAQTLHDLASQLGKVVPDDVAFHVGMGLQLSLIHI